MDDDLQARIAGRLVEAAQHAQRADILPASREDVRYGLAVDGSDYGSPLMVLSLDDVARIAAEVALAGAPTSLS